jgi:hypothetical protein
MEQVELANLILDNGKVAAIEIRMAGGVLHQPIVQLAQLKEKGGLRLIGVIAKHGVIYFSIVVIDDLRTQPPFDPGAETTDQLEPVICLSKPVPLNACARNGVAVSPSKATRTGAKPAISFFNFLLSSGKVAMPWLL